MRNPPARLNHRRPRQGVPIPGVVVLMAASMLSGCVIGISIASDGGPRQTPVAAPVTSAPETPSRMPAPVRPSTPPDAPPAALDPRFKSCDDATVLGYGPYTDGIDQEYPWYPDNDRDGVACEWY